MLDGILINFDLAPHLLGDFEGFGGGEFVGLFEDPLHEDALADVGLVVDHGFCEGLASLIAANTAVHLRQVIGDLEHFLHLPHGHRDIVVEFVHGAGLHLTHGQVFFEVIFVVEDVVLLWGDGFRTLFGAFALAFGDEEAVAGAEDAAGAALVAGAQFEEVDAIKILILQFVEEGRHVVNFIDGKVATHWNILNLSACERPKDAVFGEGMEVELVFTKCINALFDNAEHLVVQVVHIDYAIDVGFFFTDGAFHGSDFGGAGGHIEDADIFGRYTAFHEHFADIQGGDIQGGLGEQQVAHQGGIFHLDKAHDGGTEGGDDGFFCRFVFHLVVDDLFQHIHALFHLIHELEAEVVDGGEDGALAHLVGELRAEDGGYEQHRTFEVVYGIEVVLLNIDGVHGAGLVAHSAVDAAVGIENGVAVLHMDGAGGAHAGAMRATDAEVIFELESVVDVFHNGLEIVDDFYCGSFSDNRVDHQLVGVALHVGEAHAGTEAHLAHLGRGGGVTLLHGLVDVGDARAFVHQLDADAGVFQIHIDDPAVGVGHNVDLSLVERHYGTFHNSRVHTQLFHHFLHFAGGGACIGEITTFHIIFKMHNFKILINSWKSSIEEDSSRTIQRKVGGDEQHVVVFSQLDHLFGDFLPADEHHHFNVGHLTCSDSLRVTQSSDEHYRLIGTQGEHVAHQVRGKSAVNISVDECLAFNDSA